MPLGGQRYSGWYSIQTHERVFTAQRVYPTLADGALVTTHADEFTLGSFAEIVPANGIDEPFHIHHVHIIAPSENAVYECALYAATTEISRFTFSRTDKKDDVEGIEIPTVPCAANTQIQAKLANDNDASGDTVRLKIWYHIHSG